MKIDLLDDVQLRSLEELRKYVNNPKEHPDEQVKKIADSIVEFGFVQPIVINGNGRIIAGHGRYDALIYLTEQGYEIDQVPCLAAEHLSEARQKALRLADNRTAESPWDDELLGIELEELQETDLDMEVTGFDLDEIDEYIGGSEPDLDDIFPADFEEEETEAVTKKGQLLKLGRHRLFCGDCLDQENVEKLLDSTEPELLVTDPPYGMNAVTRSGKLSDAYGEDISGDENSNVAREAFEQFSNEFNFRDQIWWGSNYYSDVLPPNMKWLVWDKKQGDNDQMDAELAWTNLDSVTRMYRAAAERGTGRVHPTQKPTKLAAWCIKQCGEGDVFDPFCGVGWTIMAAEQLDRACYGIELEPQYCDVIRNRYENLTGEKPEVIE